eukprot:1181528-Prorocentrum_minimum.AAC.1
MSTPRPPIPTRRLHHVSIRPGLVKTRLNLLGITPGAHPPVAGLTALTALSSPVAHLPHAVHRKGYNSYHDMQLAGRRETVVIVSSENRTKDLAGHYDQCGNKCYRRP